MFHFLKKTTVAIHHQHSLENFEGKPSLKINPRSKRIVFRCDQKTGKPVIVLPSSFYLKKINTYEASYHQWYANLKINPPRTLSTGSSFPYKGTPHLLNFTQEKLYSTPQIIHDDGIFIIKGRAEKDLGPALKNYLVAAALDYAMEKSHLYAHKLGVELTHIAVKDMKTMWGRCMRGKDLCYNWRLILAPPEIFDYVCAHEVSHCIHPHHQPAFWKLVSSFFPRAKESRLWLKKHGPELMMYQF